MSTLEFNSLVVNVRESLYFFSSRFYKSTDDREDLVMETITKALMNKDKFNPGTNFKAWVFTIMRNTFINEYKKSKKRNELTTNEDVYSLEKHFVDTETPFHKLQKVEFDTKISVLEEKYSVPLKMYHVGYKYEEIAIKMELPLGTIKNRIHTARQILLDCYN